MDGQTKIRIGGNEAAFRSLNERLRAGTPVASSDRLFPFRCECAVLGCNQLVELTMPEYEAVRAQPTHFFLVDGHEIPEAETVLARRERYTLVSKVEEGATVAELTDPRRPGGEHV